MLYGISDDCSQKQFQTITTDEGCSYHKRIPSTTTQDPVNSMGFRGFETVPGSKDSLRVVCLGASTTYGTNLAYQETYPYLLQRFLDDMAVDYRHEVINAGQPGLDLKQIACLVDNDITKLEPDIVVVMSINNNFKAPGYWFVDVQKTDNRKNKAQRSSELLNRLRHQLKRRLVLVYAFDYWFPISLKKYFMEFDWKGFSNKLMAPDNIWEQEYRDNITVLIEKLRNANPAVKIVFLEQPFNIVNCPDMEKPFERAYMILRAVADAYAGVHSLDIYRPVLEAYRSGEKIWDLFAYDPLHWNKRGNEIIAEHVGHLIIELANSQ